MADPDWQRVVETFHRLRCRPPEERAALLDRLSAEEPGLRSEVQSLLEAHDEAGGFLAPRTVDVTAKHRLLEGDWQAGRPVGPYRLVREIGRGGMGRVFLAERGGGDYERAVALKLIDPQEVPEDFLRRFHTERQILARLSHPNIAHLYEGGTTPDGALYFAMELVEGLPIELYCDRLRLSVDQRLELFGQVLRAVRHAHACQVVHRDLKPSNILVTAEGRPKLLDFGIAKPLADEPGAGEKTATGQRVLTPLYASPEQLRGEAATAASDVYSLGVLLYRLTTGRLPRRPEGWGREEVKRVFDQGVVRPSLAVAAAGVDEPSPEQVARLRRSEPRRLGRRLRGDLDVIVLKCLQVAPERRYASVDRLALDLERSRAGLPLEARPDSLAYRTRRFVSRHRAGVGVAATVLVLLVASTVALSAMAVRLAAERDEANRGREQARQVSSLLVELLEEGDPKQGDPDGVTLREVVDWGMESIAERFDGQPEVEAQLLDAFGRLYLSLGLYDQAAPPLERALALRLAGGDAVATATSRVHLGALRRLAGDLEEAERLFRRAVASLRRAGEPHRADLAHAVGFLAELAIVAQRYDEAAALLDEGLEAARQSEGEESEGFAVLLHLLARLQMQTDDGEAARRNFARAIEIGERVLGPDHGDVRSMSLNLALLLRREGDLDGAAALYAKILAAQRRYFGPEHPKVAFTLNHLGLLHADRGELDEAEERVREALALRRKLLGEKHPAVMVSWASLGTVLYRKGDLAAAEESFRRSVTLLRGSTPPMSGPLAHALNGLGRTLLRAGRAEEAETLLAEALGLRQRLFEDPGHRLVIEAQLDLSRCWAALGRRAEAAELFATARTTVEARGVHLGPIPRRALGELTELFPAGGAATARPATSPAAPGR